MKPKLLFIHRSVGQNLIRDGKLYKLVQRAGEPFLLGDFNQNTGTLTTTDKTAVVDWRFPDGDTTSADYAALFSNERLQRGDTTLRAILGYDIVAIKSCFPNTRLTSDSMLERHKQAYKSIVDFFSSRPSKKLAILTSPPLIPLLTLPPFARRARILADWLSTSDFGPNVFVFDFFNELAVPEGKRQANTLRREYRRRFPLDSHPNELASQTIAPKFLAHFESMLHR